MLNDDFSGTFGVGFFERLGAERQRGYGDSSLDAVVDSIKRNVSHILNTRIGESQSCPELGLFDFNDASSGSVDLGLRMRNGIKACLSRFEPRLTDIDVSVLFDEGNPMNLRFHIYGSIRVASNKDKLKIDLLLDNSRRYRVV
ncbi:TPA: type VI secretion system baseplate subunit TssE [Shewanella algae]|uniref:type VI secretion system baseplate subunit TssE n=1 Tax=Shewanella algae TaxID=38313 RepID=UPI001C55E510|nr:type VI secretion system baseplate subunit TssE [Shewanella algae]HDS1200594.1 type VI secretion system baseplate subunit TssE [Shewanella algae]